MLKVYLNRDLIFINPPVKNKAELFAFIASKAEAQGVVDDADALVGALDEREDSASTVIAKHIALPHAKHATVQKPFVGMCIFSKPFPYTEGILGDKIHLAIVVGSNDADPSYLALLADVSRLLTKDDFRKGLLHAHVAEDVLLIVSKHSIQEFTTKSEQATQYLVVLILNRSIDNQVLATLLLEAGIRCLTDIRSENLFTKSFKKIPFLGGLARSMIKEDASSRCILGVSDDREITNKLFVLLKSENVDLTEPGAGVLGAQELTGCFGGVDEDIDF